MAYSILIDKYIFLLFFTHIGSLNRIFTCINNNIGYIGYLKCQYWLILCKIWRCHVFSLTRILEALRVSFLPTFHGDSGRPAQVVLCNEYMLVSTQVAQQRITDANQGERDQNTLWFLKFWGTFVLPMTKIKHVHHGKSKREERRSSWFARVVPDSRKCVYLANCCISSDL